MFNCFCFFVGGGLVLLLFVCLFVCFLFVCLLFVYLFVCFLFVCLFVCFLFVVQVFVLLGCLFFACLFPYMLAPSVTYVYLFYLCFPAIIYQSIFSYVRHQVQMTSADVLTSIIWQLIEVVRENAVGIGPFINDLFTRCKVQKALLHCLLSTLYERTGYNLPNSVNTDSPPPRVSKPPKASQLRAFQVKLLNLVQAIFVLEDNIEAVELATAEHLKSPMKTAESESTLQNNTYRYQPGKTLAYQSMLLSAVVHGLQYDDYDLHHEWLRFVIACLPHMKGALGSWVLVIVQQVGRMLQAQTGLYVPLTKTDSGIASVSR